MYICILGDEEKPLLHRNCKASPEAFLKAVEPYRDDVVVGVECMFVFIRSLCEAYFSRSVPHFQH